MSTDDGLTEAVQRVTDVLAERVGWVAFGSDTVEAIARAAREDVADRTRQAQADAWDEGDTAGFNDGMLRARAGIATNIVNPYRAAAIREGREP